MPNTVAENKALVEEFRISREAAYKKLIEAAGRLRSRATIDSNRALLLEELGKLEREFRAERRRDYFRSPSRNEAAGVLRELRREVL